MALSVVFFANGKVDNIKVVRGLSHGLNEQAQAAARQILFLPAIKNGKFVSTRLQLEFTYNLYKAHSAKKDKDCLLMREFLRDFPGLFRICEPSHAAAVNGFTAGARALVYLAGVNGKERQRGVLCDSANQQRDLRLGAE